MFGARVPPAPSRTHEKTNVKSEISWDGTTWMSIGVSSPTRKENELERAIGGEPLLSRGSGEVAGPGQYTMPRLTGSLITPPPLLAPVMEMLQARARSLYFGGGKSNGKKATPVMTTPPVIDGL